MEIKLAKTAGFCMGVRRAVDIVLEIAQHETGRSIYTYGPLIHNPQTIELLKGRGIKPIDNIDEIIDKQNAVLIIRAHGIAPAQRKKIKASGVKIIDCTCPKVGYVQAIIKKHTALNYTVIIVGDREHPEVNALLGYTGGRGITVITAEDVDSLPPLINVCVVAQTTQNYDDYKKIVSKIKKLYPQAVVFNTICSSTQQRQAEVIALADEMDAIFIVGGKNSANTKRLADLARKQQTPTFHIETAAEMEKINLVSYNSIGVSAGASTPNWIIDRVMDKITDGRSRKFKAIGFLLNLWVSAIKTDIYSAIGAGCLCAACMLLQGMNLSIAYIAIASFFVYDMKIMPKGWRFQSLKDLPGSKNIFMAIAWGTVTAILPALNINGFLNASMVVAFCFAFGIVFIRSAMSDILEFQSDKLIGRETIPVLFGKNNTKIVLKLISFILLALLLFSYFARWTSYLSFFLLACVLYIWICFHLCDRKAGLSGAVMEGLLETLYIIAGLSVFLWSFF